MNFWIIPGLKYRETKRLQSNSIITVVCKYFDLELIDIKSKCRNRNFVIPRQISMYFIRKYTPLTLFATGKLFNRDHTTVLHSISTVNGFLSIKDTGFMKIIFDIENEFVLGYGLDYDGFGRNLKDIFQATN